jgi:biopolymer transport protein ExbD
MVSFILCSPYAPHPIAVNLPKSALFVAYVKEREKAVEITSDGSVSLKEQLVWMLWKILKGDGNDVGVHTF